MPPTQMSMRRAPRYFPSLSLTGGAGYGPSSGHFQPVQSGHSSSWSIGASILQSIFDGGRIHAQNDLAKATEQQLIAAYRKAVFTAFRMWRPRWDRLSPMTDQLALIEIETKADAEAFRISELEYREGTIDIISLLDNQQNLFTAQQSLVQTKLAELEASISLYNALGGGWEQKADDCGLQEPARLVAAVSSFVTGVLRDDR